LKRGLNGSQEGTGDLFKSNQYKRFSQNEYEIYLQSYAIKKYLSKLIEVQESFKPIFLDMLQKCFPRTKIEFCELENNENKSDNY